MWALTPRQYRARVAVYNARVDEERAREERELERLAWQACVVVNHAGRPLKHALTVAELLRRKPRRKSKRAIERERAALRSIFAHRFREGDAHAGKD